MKWFRLAIVAAVLVATVPAIAGAGSGDSGQSGSTPAEDIRANHREALEFWTHARVARAIPRDMVLDAPDALGIRVLPTHHAPGHCGGPPGAPRDCPGDTTTTTTSTTTTTTTVPGDGDEIIVVTGASWTQGGDIADASGKVLFALGSSYYVCSASVVADGVAGRSVIVTAAHCVYDEVNDEFAQHWVFIPNYDLAPAPLSTSNSSYCADTHLGCWSAAALFVHDGYASQSSFNSTATQYDFGFAMVLEGGHDGDHLDEMVTPLGIEFSAVPTDNSVQGWAFGYPAAQKYNGRDLTYCANGATADPNNGNATYRLALCEMTGGSSGGPWIMSKTIEHNGVVFSLNSYGYRGVKAMYGPKFNASTSAVFNAARTLDASVEVG
jgi:hypothetical protein